MIVILALFAAFICFWVLLEMVTGKQLRDLIDWVLRGRDPLERAYRMPCAPDPVQRRRAA